MSTFNRRASKRRRKRPPQAFQSQSASEERLLHQAIQNSKLDNARPKDGKLDLPWAPTFYPTVEEMEGNPLDYIEKIRPVAQKYGICKIVPPEGWNPAPFTTFVNKEKRFQTKHQLLHRLQEGISFGDGEEYNVNEYQRMASKATKEYKARHYPDHDAAANIPDRDIRNERRFTPDNLERDYWEIVETRSREFAVEYGNDVDTDTHGSGFPLSERGRSVNGKRNPKKMAQPEPKFGTEDYYKETYWNVNNIPWAPKSILRHVKVGINGINVPWMYYGSLFTTFCWHNEDNYLYSINYHHKGAPKQWYGIPGYKKDAEGLEKVFRSYLSMKMRDCPDLLHHITTMFSPRLLQNADVPVYKLLQYEGEYVVTFPQAFHGGFSMGPNCGEAVNFATHDWIAHGFESNERYRALARPAVFSHDRLTFTMANHLEDQTSYATCRLLLDELERVVNEELELRKRLITSGVRDVSNIITLPECNQLDEESAEYDDKRLCHACKHVCFFTAVACECSQSKVSCLRHSQYMCVCSPERKYLLQWFSNRELESLLERVRVHCDDLKLKNGTSDVGSVLSRESDGAPMPPMAPGAERSIQDHLDEEICIEPFDAPKSPRSSKRRRSLPMPEPVSVSSPSSSGSAGSIEEDGFRILPMGGGRFVL